MSTRRNANDWLEWAQARYDAAQERYAWSSRADSATMDSYAELVSLIEAGIQARSRKRTDENEGEAALLTLASQMETLGKEGFAFPVSSMVEAARTIRGALERV